ncbi:MAG: bifunctional aconitate hydratase 2/2-methylisocitrate dehydratase [Candidatus Methanoperedens sp.]|nr:bifunctional aconitate hydratase 2/2-methylisocitrate dehydratase [Candidatus Methanoperedens sp.]MCZ7395193.1 bifunctional aconitate hydratase 2/2-methylisocitrate dehydratase [Candidatus Methanoperedens sp.]
MIPEIIESYQKHITERQRQGIPPLPLNAEQVKALSELALNPPEGREELILKLLKEHIPPGVDHAALEKAKLLRSIALREKKSRIISPHDAVALLGMMKGGYNIETLIELLDDKTLASDAASALSDTILIFGFFDRIEKLARTNHYASKVLESWAKAEWFLRSRELPKTQKVAVFKIPGEVNTDDLSPASRAGSRADIPLHALSMLESRYPTAINDIVELKKKGYQVAFAADVVGTGSSRKSAMNSLLWWIGEDIPGVPNKRRGGVILGSQIAPIFFNTARDSGAFPIRCNVSQLETGMVVTIDFEGGRILDRDGNEVTAFNPEPETLPDEYRAGGRLLLIIGKELTRKAQEALGKKYNVFIKPKEPEASKKGYTLAQKIVGRACGLRGVRPGQACLPRITTVGSQDTTGPMTAEEIKELACIEFQAPLVMQSFCHTAAYPTPKDRKMHRELAQFFRERGGVVLKPGDGIIHSWLNRMLLPDTVGTGGDSHTRFPIGISFPAGSGLVAFAASLGVMPLDMPQSMLVRFKGKLRKGIFLRDVVNAIPYFALKNGKLTLEKKDKKNIFNGRIIEMDGLPDITVEQAFELTDSSAERSAEAAVIALSKQQVMQYLRNNISILKSLLDEGYASAALERRIEAMEEWLANPSLLQADADAEYADVLEIDLSEITEPLLSCPNDPDYIRPLSQVAGEKIDEVFMGSCMIGFEHFQRAAGILGKAGRILPKLWIAPPTRLVEKSLKDTGGYSRFKELGARMEIPGCSLCMGNQARVADNAVVFSTSTRNFDNRMGKNAKVYLGSAELAAITAMLGRIPALAEYFELVEER